MNAHVLDNPIWGALTTFHADRAVGGELAKRYLPEVAPFAALLEPGEAAERELLSLVSPGETVCFLTHAPTTDDCRIKNHITLVQFVWPEGAEPTATQQEIVELTEADLPAMLELTALVYPAYFRRGTAQLGTYFGIKDGGRLCSMAGIRMAMPGYQEISAVCTHPDYRNRGYARELMLKLVRFIRAGSNTPFLHTEAENTAARGMYSKLGFAPRREMLFWVMERV